MTTELAAVVIVQLTRQIYCNSPLVIDNMSALSVGIKGLISFHMEQPKVIRMMAVSGGDKSEDA